MAKFHGPVGYATTVKTAPGVSEETIIEVNYFGDLIRNSRRLEESLEKVNFDLSLGNSVSIVADAYANEHFFAIRYVKWAGGYWTVTNVDVRAPRLILRLGGVYNGPKA